MRKFLKILAFFIIILTVTVLGFYAYLVISVADIKFDENKLSLNSIKFEYYDNEETIISNSYYGNKEYVSIDKLSENTKNAFISIEDKRFYNHKGVDYIRILGATKNNILSFSFKEGASTISQQLIKNTHLTQEKTLKRKFAEIKLAKQLEKKYSKNQILEKYLNTIYFGAGAYGIQDASKKYFGKNAEELTLNEAATLAAIIKAPSKYSPLINKQNSYERKNIVLKTMLDNNFIQENEYKKNKDIQAEIKTENNTDYLQPYILAAYKEFEKLFEFNPYIKEKTYKIFTYLDANLQKNIAETTVENTENYSNNQIVINNKNCAVIAFYGDNYNLKRSPASCIKPWYIYAPCIEEKFITEQTQILDEAVNYSGYIPNNFNGKFHGYVSAKYAMSNSLNIPAVKLYDGIGYNKAEKYAKKMNINIENKNLANALGAIDGGMTLSELCNCYIPFSNCGNFEEIKFIKRIESQNGLIYKRKNNATKVFSEETAFIINDMLKETVKNGTAKKLNLFNFDIYAKTGTNGNNKGNIDAYCISYTSKHTVGIWIGNEDNSLMPNNVTGGNYPAIYCREIYNYLYKYDTPENFSKPENVIEKYIDKKSLEENQKILLTNNEEEGILTYFIKGTEPTEYAKKSTIIPKLKNAQILSKNGQISFIFDNNNCNGFLIKYKYNGKENTLYDDTFTSIYNYQLKHYGKYNFSVTPYILINGEKILGKEINLPSVLYSKNSDKIINEEWWNK